MYIIFLKGNQKVVSKHIMKMPVKGLTSCLLCITSSQLKEKLFLKHIFLLCAGQLISGQLQWYIVLLVVMKIEIMSYKATRVEKQTEEIPGQ